MRAAVYSGTRNIYEQMLTSAKSLLMHSNVETIYFLIEDDQFPYTLPEEIKCINISGQTYFPKDGPNFNNVCTYMVLIRAAFTKIFPKLDKILSIDMDTVVNENISELWDLDLTNYYLAAVEEKDLSLKEGSYFNMGVAMLNLKKIREDKKDDELINAINTYWYRYKEQDCFNEFFRGHVLILPSDYNVCIQANPPMHEKITHFAGHYKLNNFPNFNYYKNLSLSELKRNVQDNITLDIIIPTYKNKKGLRKTLNSIPSCNDINVIVVDDCSNLDYTDIIEEYPSLHLYCLDTNQGPGMARQYGLNHSNGTYILFLDTGDYFYKNGLETIMENIKKNTYIKLYTFSYVYDDKNILADKPDDKTIGSVYKRSFIEMYNIHFSKEGSYANEDYGFSRACKIILRQLEEIYFFPDAKYHCAYPTFYEHIDSQSLTKINNSDFFYTKLSKGIITNGVHAIQIAQQAEVKPKFIIEEYNYIMVQEYFFFMCYVHERPDIIDEVWNNLYDFYHNYYFVYKKFSKENLLIQYSQIILPRLKNRMKTWSNFMKPNILRFLNELETEKNIPLHYYL